MYNHVIKLNFNKTVIISISFIFLYIVNLGVCFSNVLLPNKFFENNEKYNFVQFDLLFGKNTSKNLQKYY